MVLIFDLDDTLYEERTYVESGFRAVAQWGKDRFGWEAERSFITMVKVLSVENRGTVFNRWLQENNIKSKKIVKECVAVYRHHTPHISVSEPIRNLLISLNQSRLYLVTDGHKVVQAKKIAALGITPLFRRCYITHRYGVASAKPSLRCFDLIKSRERCTWNDLAYIGDNPEKDFVSLNTVGAHTIRVKTGMHKHSVAKPGFEAQHVIMDLLQLPSILNFSNQ